MSIFSAKEKTPSQTVIEDVLHIKKNETALIIANPETNLIAQDLFTALKEAGTKPSLIFQNRKTSSDAAEDAVIGAIKSEPDVILSISACKLGRDTEATATPYKDSEGNTYDSAFDYLLEGKKCTRAVWTPGLTEDMFNRTVQIDYKLLAERCKKICAKYENAISVHVTSPNGTDVTVPVEGRNPLTDDGDFSTPGSGGNIPAGEVFISPVVGSGNTVGLEASKKNSEVKTGLTNAFDKIKEKTQEALETVYSSKEEVKEQTETKQTKDNASINSVAQNDESPHGTSGTIVFDGSMTFSDGDALLETPITVKVEEGFVTDITGGKEAKRLLHDIQNAERESAALELSGKLPKGMGAVYARNARNIGELGIGLNPNANITGNMLEDEKAFRTCHFAIGQNYDGDAPSLIHFDGVIRNPTIVIKYNDGSEYMLLDCGELKL